MGSFDLATGVTGNLRTLCLQLAPAGEAGVWGLMPSPVHRGRIELRNPQLVPQRMVLRGKPPAVC